MHSPCIITGSQTLLLADVDPTRDLHTILSVQTQACKGEVAGGVEMLYRE